MHFRKNRDSLITPNVASDGWNISQKRRKDDEEESFIGTGSGAVVVAVTDIGLGI